MLALFKAISYYCCIEIRWFFLVYSWVICLCCLRNFKKISDFINIMLPNIIFCTKPISEKGKKGWNVKLPDIGFSTKDYVVECAVYTAYIRRVVSQHAFLSVKPCCNRWSQNALLCTAIKRSFMSVLPEAGLGITGSSLEPSHSCR